MGNHKLFVATFRSQEAGPIASLFALELLGLSGAKDQMTRPFVRYGLARLSFDAAWKDFLALFPDVESRDEVLAAAGSVLRSLSASGAELGPLTGTLKRIDAKASDVTVTRAALRLLWNCFLRARVQDELQSYAK